MSGFSVGSDFVDDQGRSIDWRRAHPDVLRDRAFYDLTEVSAVPIPSDPNALAERTWNGMASLTRELSTMFSGPPPSHYPGMPYGGPTTVDSGAARAFLDTLAGRPTLAERLAGEIAEKIRLRNLDL